VTRLEQLRLDALMTHLELQTATGVAIRTIRNIERGETDRPQLDTLRKLAGYFNVPASELLLPAIPPHSAREAAA
jgi:transcriptional regulator with XRE-family HTH domain